MQNDGEWLAGPTTRLTIPAHIAPFRLPEWDRSRAWSVRVVPLLRDGREAPSEYHYLGHIPAEQAAARPSRVLLFHCPRMVGVSNDQDYAARPAEQAFERFTSRNLIMPATASQRRMEDELQPDLLVFTGDQMYEQIPTLPDVDDAGSPRADDYLYRWLLFLRTFGHLTRRVPTVTIPDDHDLYLGNIWGWSGREPRGARGEPGYNHERGWAFSVGFYNLVIDTQTSHLPPPADPTPMPRGLKKYYTRLDYGGISYAIIEGRTYKTPPYPEFVDNPDSASLLGESQLAFVKSWGASLPSDTPRIAISQTVFANPMTNADGSLSKNEYDANAWPAPGRDRAVEAFKEAGALLVGGDIHNAVFLKHGVDSDEDGPYQFIPCAFGQFFQRWWEPREEGRDRRPTDPPFTGLHRDGEGHRFRMIACTNARISFAEAQRAGFIIGRFIIDPNLTRSGYGLLEIDPSASTVVIEHWDREADAAGRPAQFEGWPVVLPIPKPKYDGLERHQGVGRGSQTTP
ncbi:MAG: alkaline phosphatase D family protein [Planctomycetota bacterium]